MICLATALYFAVWAAAHGDEQITSFDGALVAALKKKQFGVAKTKARALVMMVEKNQIEFLGYDESKSISRFLENRRKR